LLSLAVLFVSSPAPAQVIFSNFSDNPAATNYPYLGNPAGYVVEWNMEEDYNGTRCAMPFTNNTGADQHLGTVSLAVYKNPDHVPANLTVRLVKDNGHYLPSAAPADILETLAVDPAIVEDSESFLNLASTNNPLLLSGAIYWVTVEPSRIDTNSPAQDVLYYWIENNAGSKFSYTYDSYGFYDGWTGYYNQPDPPNRFIAPTLQVTVVPPPRPVLSITVQGANAVVQWPTNSANGFRLESQNTMQSGVWSPVSDTPQPNGEFWQITQSLDSATKFYRLVNP
jgi:hypothetical protein